MAWSGQHRAFVVEEFIKNGGSVITTQRAFRLHFAIGRRDPIPTGPTIRNWVSNFRATSSALKTRPQGRIRTSTSAENVDRVRASIQQSPRRSVRKHAASLGLSFSSVRRILHRDLKFHPYKIQVVQELTVRDLDTRTRTRIIENSNNIKLPEFVNVKQEPYLPDFDSETPETNIYNDIKPNINIKTEPGLQSMNIEVKQDPLDFEAEEEKLEVFKPIIQSVKSESSNIYISDVSEEVLNLNSTKDGKFMCPMCYKRFASKSNVQRHILLHTREKYECKTCFRQFVNPHHYERHLLTHSTEKRYKCDDCGKLFRTASNLKQHKRTHRVVKPFECEQCERKFDLKANLLRHQSRGNCKKLNKEPIVCTICDKTFKKEFLLKSHLRKHTTEKQFICDKCQMAFKYKSTLIRHVQLHNGIKPYSCKICRKTFTHAGRIKPHMRLHTGEKPYKCPVCNKLFAHKHNMQRHTLCHAKKKHLVCDVCNKTFPIESRLKYHMRTHTKAKH